MEAHSVELFLDVRLLPSLAAASDRESNERLLTNEKLGSFLLSFNQRNAFGKCLLLES